jgi:zinc transporter ZupT
MSLFLKTVIISALMILLCGLPLFFSQIKKISRLLFLMGTGALIGICGFDLIPDVIALGGNASLLLVFVVWLIYSAIHFMHDRKQPAHADDELTGHVHAGTQGISMFLASMMIHCGASGVLLAISIRYNAQFSRAVFLALVAHKGYESLIVATVILERVRRRSHAILAIVAYALSLPFGVAMAMVFQNQINAKLALFATCFALGTLLGCMVFDFILPSLVHVKKQKFELGWIIFGLALTELLMKTQS